MVKRIIYKFKIRKAVFDHFVFTPINVNKKVCKSKPNRSGSLSVAILTFRL